MKNILCNPLFFWCSFNEAKEKRRRGDECLTQHPHFIESKFFLLFFVLGHSFTRKISAYLQQQQQQKRCVSPWGFDIFLSTKVYMFVR